MKPSPLSSYPAKFRLGEGDEYVKYGHAALNPGRRGSDPFWTPQVITQIWYQAETGKIPISGGGYGGPFAGEGFDGLWLDMSEIVRPTRDGIHGREYISTAIDLGRKPSMLRFDAAGRLALQLPSLLEIPIPIPGGNLFSLASGGAIYLRDPHLKVGEDQLNGGRFVPLTPADWKLILPYLSENERLFGISVADGLLTVSGVKRRPAEVYRKIEATRLAVLV